ncbi:MAG: 3-isopropylmalate dehydratase small subunit [Opitutales bacterium]|nr:3-isopropylmalate dehydratase small subunit [Opitutales bacterium]
MSLPKITSVSGRAVPVSGDDIDTDRIIPARFMKCVTFDGLGQYLFNDVRRNEDGSEKAHNLNDPRFAGATILISGNNFGCGSSREHAPQAIFHAGYRAVIAEGYAEIFFGNSTQLGIPCMSVSHEDRLALEKAVEAAPQTEIVIDVEKEEIRFAGKTIKASIRESARAGLISGRWDPLADLLAASEEVASVVAKQPYMAAPERK